MRANSWATTNSKPPGPIIMIDQSEINTEPQSGPIYYTLLYAGAQRCWAFLPPAIGKRCSYAAEPKLFSWAKPACFDFSSSNFTVQDHLWSTQLEMLSGKVEETRRKLMLQNRCYIGFQSSSSRCDKIARLLHRGFVSTAAASDEENLKGFLRPLRGLGFRF